MAAPRRSAWVLACLPVAAAVVVAVTLVGRPGRGADGPAAPVAHDRSSEQRPPSPPDVGPARGGTPNAAPGGFARRRDGAAAAAVAYLGVLPSLVVAEPSEREAVLAAMTAPGSPGVFTRTLEGLAVLDRSVAEARSALPGARVLVREVPVSYTVAAFDDSRARVEVWSVGVVLIEGRTDATEVWSTNTVELAWDGGDWKVWAWSRTPGPVPAPSTDSPTAPAAVLAGVGTWEGLRYAPAA